MRDEESSRIGGRLVLMFASALGFAQSKESETYVMVSNVAAHPYWIDAKKGGEDAANELG